jgi:branched-chain amino acid transport system ATP-binding protein
MRLLETAGLCVSFGGVQANDHVDIAVEAGMLVGLIGPNGAGKTTFLDAITGFVEPSSGTVVFDGVDATRQSPTRRARSGLARTFQSLELFEDLSVLDNVLVTVEQANWYSFLRDIVRIRRTSGAREQAEWALSLVGLESLRDRLPSNLSNGQRKLVAVARAVAGRPKLLLLDEPAAGLDTAESQALGRQLRQLLDEDISLLLIDHDMGLVLTICDYVYVLDFGRIIAEGPPTKIRSNAEVITAYLGDGVIGGKPAPADLVGSSSPDLLCEMTPPSHLDGTVTVES